MNKVRPIAVVAPHPDDETLGCGGTIKHLTLSSIPVDVIFLTCGELGFAAPEAATAERKKALAAVRSDEAREACDILGVRNVIFLHGTDGATTGDKELGRALFNTLAETDYQRVLFPWHGEAHADHRGAFNWTREALLRHPSRPDAWMYEVWTPMRPNTYVPIGGTIQFKQSAIERHRSQLKVLDYRGGFLGLASYRALFCPGARYAEAFLVWDFEELVRQPVPT